MGKRGPTPKPNHLKVVEGAEERHINRLEPQPERPDTIEPPTDLSDEAREVWDRLVPDMVAKGVLTPWDVDSFVIFCEAVATYHKNKALMGDQYTARGAAGGVIKSPHWQIMRDAQSIITQIGSKFGLTPGDRAGIAISKQESKPEHGGERLLS